MSEQDITPQDQDVGATHPDAPMVDVDNRTEDQMLDAILRRSEFTRDVMESLPEEHTDVPAPEGVEYDDDLETPEVIEEVEEVEAIEEEVVGEDDTSTQDTIYELDDLDDFQVWTKIDGERVPVNISELVKSYQTDQHLSNKGRELGDARKALDAEREEKLNSIDNVVSAASEILAKQEKALAKEYHELEAQIQEARDNDDDYSLTKLKDKQEQAQKKYWAAAEERKRMIETAEEQKHQLHNHQFQEKMQVFAEGITTAIPDWSEDVAKDIREFALSRGIPESIINSMVDINSIKLVDDFRRAELARSTGAKKREKAPVRVPTKKARSPQEQREVQDSAMRDKVLSGQGTKQEEEAFLRNMAARHF